MAEKEKMPVAQQRGAAPARRDDWMPFDSLQREIERLFDDFRPFGWRLPSTRSMFDPDRSGRQSAWRLAPAFDVVEKGDCYEITAELPGIDEKDIQVKVSNHMMTIKGEKKEQKEEGEGDYHLSERRFGSFQRSFQLPENIDAEKIEATFSKGILQVKVPKTPEAQHAEKQISIKAA
ncbi:Hsp20/alpha crystallin family protein [Pseudaminobacter sp. 19-2017]|uniref:Hsp20/alpha crystallin family protein n=1 Tax=Pseudaminobacter soli (ex Zhang et al. 2022) TaxID=2831468 RepID=A0A942DYX3_9HYPH|nr:Hsp20/alpha crystallin family protein [Pseudaminobacter soli]MBS3649948.1 Hsp20/alpha crystallin family protein [Pseudaminobacter soli]